MIKHIFLCLILCISTAFGGKIRVLSCDGGGVRGAATLKIMKQLQQDTAIKFHQDFDVFAGTSTGSIIAFACALGVDVDEILTDYVEISGDVFTRATYLTLLRPEYNPNLLKSALVQILEKKGYTASATLGDLSKKVIIPTVVLDDPATGRWRMQILENFTEEGKKIKIIDAVIESTAAPTYFPSSNGHIDGGIAMNDPSLAALMTAFNPETCNFEDFEIFAVGTGYTKEAIEGDEDWGTSQWLANVSGGDTGSLPLVDVLMDVQDQVPSQVCSKLLGSRYMKFNFPLSESFAIDAAYKIPELIKCTADYIDQHPEEWSMTTSWVEEHILR